jgi:predicted acyl esterase
MTRPLRGPLNTSAVDHSTDAYDTIDWLVKNVPESNGRVGMVGSSYEGFTVAMALVNPHPALKAAVPESPMVDGWMGDDWFHYGAFRQTNLDYFADQHGSRQGRDVVAGLRRLRKRRVGRRLRESRRSDHSRVAQVAEHPACARSGRRRRSTRSWQRGLTQCPRSAAGSGTRRHVGRTIATRRSSRRHSQRQEFLIMGPWFHSQINRDGSSLGPLHWNGERRSKCVAASSNRSSIVH